jgi:Protein of unknown function (DUF2934)
MQNTLARTQKTSKPAAKKAGSKAAVAAKSRRSNAKARAEPAPALSAQERERLIAQAAYFRAERRGFAPGGELQDWIEAETEVQRLIGSA